MINREDMLELTRRMSVSRSSFTRIAGGYIDIDGFVDGTFNVNFLNLSTHEKTKHLAIAKTIPFSNTNENLVEYPMSVKNRDVFQLLNGMKSCGLKNDALMNNLYEIIAERYQSVTDYAILVYHDRYDVPIKASDKERLGESEEVYEYLIGAICPLIGEYEPGVPDFGFLYPMFTDRSSDESRIGIYQKDKYANHNIFKDLFLK